MLPLKRQIILVQPPRSKKPNYITKKIIDTIICFRNCQVTCTLEDGSHATVGNRQRIEIRKLGDADIDIQRIKTYLKGYVFSEHQYVRGCYHTAICDTIMESEVLDISLAYYDFTPINCNLIVIDVQGAVNTRELETFRGIKYAYELEMHPRFGDLPLNPFPNVKYHNLTCHKNTFLMRYNPYDEYNLIQILVYFDNGHTMQNYEPCKAYVVKQSEVPVIEKPICRLCNCDIYGYFYIAVDYNPGNYHHYCPMCVHNIYYNRNTYIIGKSLSNISERKWVYPDIGNLYKMVKNYERTLSVNNDYHLVITPTNKILILSCVRIVNAYTRIGKICMDNGVTDIFTVREQ